MPKITQSSKAKNVRSKRVLGDSFIARKRKILRLIRWGVQRDCLNLIRNASHELKKDKEVVFEAVKKNGWVLRYDQKNQTLKTNLFAYTDLKRLWGPFSIQPFLDMFLNDKEQYELVYSFSDKVNFVDLVAYKIASFLSFKEFHALRLTFIKKKPVLKTSDDISRAAKDTVLSHALES